MSKLEISVDVHPFAAFRELYVAASTEQAPRSVTISPGLYFELLNHPQLKETWMYTRESTPDILFEIWGLKGELDRTLQKSNYYLLGFPIRFNY